MTGSPAPDVAEPEDGGAVRDDGDHVALRGVVVDGLGVLLDRQTRRGNARCIGAAEVIPRAEGDGRGDGEFAVITFVQFECFCVKFTCHDESSFLREIARMLS